MLDISASFEVHSACFCDMKTANIFAFIHLGLLNIFNFIWDLLGKEEEKRSFSTLEIRVCKDFFSYECASLGLTGLPKRELLAKLRV